MAAFGGSTPAEAFGKATAWLAGHPEVAAIDVGWHTTANGFELRLFTPA